MLAAKSGLPRPPVLSRNALTTVCPDLQWSQHHDTQHSWRSHRAREVECRIGKTPHYWERGGVEQHNIPREEAHSQSNVVNKFELPPEIGRNDSTRFSALYTKATPWANSLSRPAPAIVGWSESAGTKNKRRFTSNALVMRAITKSKDQDLEEARQDGVTKDSGRAHTTFRPTYRAPPHDSREKLEAAKMVAELERNSPLNRMVIAKPRVGDAFCARLLATTFFSVRSIINVLELLQVKNVGPHAVRSILLRCISDGSCDIAQVREYLDHLDQIGISIGSSVFCRLVTKLLATGNTEMLYDLALCDQHPDAIDDYSLQETLLAQYDGEGNKREFDRTMAILTIETTTKNYELYYKNYLLNAALSRRDDDVFRERLEDMLRTGVPLTKRTRSHLYVRLAWVYEENRHSHESPQPPRRNVDGFISIMKLIMSQGTHVTPKEWKEPLSWLLHDGRLSDFEELLSHLLRWYSDPGLQAEQTNRTYPSIDKDANHSDWNVLIEESTIAVILQMGMYAAAKDHKNDIPPQGSSFEERAADLAKHPSLWGLQLLAKLRDQGYPIPREQVKRVCVRRLWTLFSLGFRAHARNRTIKAARRGSAKEYILAMEMIWGSDLFARTSTSDFYAAQLVYLANRIWYRQIRAMLYYVERYRLREFRKTKARNKEESGNQTRFGVRELRTELAVLEAAGVSIEEDPNLHVSLETFLEHPSKNPGSVHAKDMKLLASERKLRNEASKEEQLPTGLVEEQLPPLLDAEQEQPPPLPDEDQLPTSLDFEQRPASPRMKCQN